MFYRIIFVLIILILIIMVFFVKIKIVIEYRKAGKMTTWSSFFVLKKRFGYKKNKSTEEKDGILTDYKKLIKI